MQEALSHHWLMTIVLTDVLGNKRVFVVNCVISRQVKTQEKDV